MPSGAEAFLGKRYATDFTVVAVSYNEETEPEVVLLMHGDYYRISAEELQTIIERGLVAEMPPGQGGERHGT
jgi:hypothetical protein